jgi:cytochrome d ubiquinol oxidase subunit II
MLASAAFGMYPYVLPSIQDPALSLTIHNTAASPYGLRVGLVWFIPGIALAAAYFIYTYRSFAGKVPAADDPPDRNS